MDEKFTRRTDFDFLRRSMPGVAVYIVTWPVLCWTLDYYTQHPLLAFGFTSMFIGISVLRIMHAYSTRFIYEYYPNLWRAIIYSLSMSHSLLLSILVVMAITVPTYEKIALPIIIMVSAIACGAVSSLSVKYKFSQYYLASLVLPIIISAQTTPEYSYLSIMFLILWTYFYFLLRRFNQEYVRAFNTENALLENQKKLEELNITDALTGVYNRQYFDRALDSQWDLDSRSKSELSILFLDLDFFKKINDEYGHLIGDKALCHAATVFRETTKRKTDMIARYGGEEFAIILPSTPHQDALLLAEKIRENLESSPLIVEKKSISLTVSIGVNTIIPSKHTSCILFLDDVDKALYEAKRTGRNKVSSFINSTTS